MNHFCKQASKLTSDVSERRLTWMERLSLRMHLFMCRMCREDVHNTQWLSQLFEKIRADDGSDHHACLPKDKRQHIDQKLSQLSDKKSS